MITLKELAQQKDPFTAGHTLCPGCGIPVLLKIVLRSSTYPLVVVNATGCLQMASVNFPFTAWNLNWLHNSIDNAPATMSGIQAAWKALRKKGKYSQELNFLVIGGDVATYDSGLASLSGAIERGEKFVYLCYDNQLYVTTGRHCFSQAPMRAQTDIPLYHHFFAGKLHSRKDIIKIMLGHKVPYIAQGAPWNWHDLYMKAEKAFATNGPAYLNVLSPCPTEWQVASDQSISQSKLATDCCVWPVFEVMYGSKLKINYKPKEIMPVTEWLNSQGRFRYLLKRENKWVVERFQEEINRDWDELQELEEKKTEYN